MQVRSSIFVLFDTLYIVALKTPNLYHPIRFKCINHNLKKANTNDGRVIGKLVWNISLSSRNAIQTIDHVVV